MLRYDCRPDAGTARSRQTGLAGTGSFPAICDLRFPPWNPPPRTIDSDPAEYEAQIHGKQRHQHHHRSRAALAARILLALSRRVARADRADGDRGAGRDLRTPAGTGDAGGLERLSPEIGKKLLAALPTSVVVETMRKLDPVRLAHLLAGLDDDERERLLALVGERTAKEVRAALLYPPDRAGALMDPRARLFRQNSTVAEVLARLRQDRRPAVPASSWWIPTTISPGGWTCRRLRWPGLTSPSVISSRTSRPSSSRWLPGRRSERRWRSIACSDLAVLDLDGRLIGVIRYTSMVEAEKERASVGIQTMVGVSKDERATSKVSFAVRKRLPWLQVNLITAFIAASVVGLFEHTIAQFTALAVLLPVVAGQSGNTGAQALAVTMRGLALREIRAAQWPRVVFKETNVGFWNGVTVAFTTAAGVLVWSGSYGLALIIATSMVLSMIIAGIAGAAIPIVLTVLGQDPAQSSSIILTTVTDVTGFFSFLGIATLLAGLI